MEGRSASFLQCGNDIPVYEMILGALAAAILDYLFLRVALNKACCNSLIEMCLKQQFTNYLGEFELAEERRSQ